MRWALQAICLSWRAVSRSYNSIPGQGAFFFFHLAIDGIDRVPMLKDRVVYLKQYLKGKLIGHMDYIRIHGEGMPEIRERKWPAQLTESQHK
jgi:hypothetical protein